VKWTIVLPKEKWPAHLVRASLVQLSGRSLEAFDDYPATAGVSLLLAFGVWSVPPFDSPLGQLGPMISGRGAFFSGPQERKLSEFNFFFC
jgi:hypothetical protein